MELIIHNGNFQQFLDPVVGGDRKARGLIPRNYTTHPVGSYSNAPAFAVSMPTISTSEWSERIKDKVATKSQLSDIRMIGNRGAMIPSIDQTTFPFCWAHSTVSAVHLLRAVMGEPYVPLSAFACACIVNDYKQEGGWGAKSLEFATDRGIPSQKFWPQGSMSRSNDKPETWADAARHKVTEGWWDLQAAAYDRKLSFEQEATCLLTNTPVVKDENWWSHSICGCDLVEGASLHGSMRAESGKLVDAVVIEAMFAMPSNPTASGFGVRIWNSWNDGWGTQGMGVLAGDKAISDGATAPRVTTPSDV